MGGKPNKGTKKDKRLKENQPKKGKRRRRKPFASTRSKDGTFPI